MSNDALILSTTGRAAIPLFDMADGFQNITLSMQEKGKRFTKREDEFPSLSLPHEGLLAVNR